MSAQSPLDSFISVYYSPVVLELVLSGQSVEDQFTPCCCGAGCKADAQDCHITANGTKDFGLVLALDGPRPLHVRAWRCATHNSSFSVLSHAFLSCCYEHYTWQQLQPEPLVLKHGRTVYTAELAQDIISMYENRVTVKQIIDIIQQRWRRVYAMHADEANRHRPTTQRLQLHQPWWVQLHGKQVMTDRRKMANFISDYFTAFLKPQFMADMQLARERFCYGISIDETYKLALKCSVAVHTDQRTRRGRLQVQYKPASYALHTVHSSVTQMVAAFRFMPNKSASQKAVALKAVWEAQGEAIAAGRPAVITRFVASDVPDKDHVMVQVACQSVFPSSGDHWQPVDVGDDVWHARERVAKHLGAGHPGKPALRRVFHLVYKSAKAGDVSSLSAWGDFLAALDAWAAEYGPLPAKADAALQSLRWNSQSLFVFLPHKEHLMRYGTTANEHGNWVLNRRQKFVSHMRPDRCMAVIMYTVLLHNRARAATASTMTCLTEDDQQVVSQLFAADPHVPFHRAAECPFIVPLAPAQRQYSALEYEEQFGSS
jgi:hypothetical protein